jgi:hypothetical protein
MLLFLVQLEPKQIWRKIFSDEFTWILVLGKKITSKVSALVFSELT